jgi:DNA-binding transcriptional ArsR family regulator
MRDNRGVAADLTDPAPLFAALGDSTRMRIVARLCEAGPLSIVRLTRGARISRQAITKHLRALAAAGVVRSDRVGRERIWELQTARLEQISDQWNAALERLRAFVEKHEHSRRADSLAAPLNLRQRPERAIA